MNFSIEKFNSDLQAFCEWATKIKLETNAEKSEAIIMKAKDLSAVPAITLTSQNVLIECMVWKYSKLVKNFGQVYLERPRR